MEIRIGHNKAVAVGLIVVAAFGAVVQGIVSNPSPLQLLVTVLMFVMGVLLLRWTLVVVTPNAVERKNLFGRTMKSFPIDSLADITLNGNTIMVGGEKVIAGGSMHGGDVAKLRAAIDSARDAKSSA
ncbi:MAG: hypothetical protein AAF500_06755 [Myxococcota bacterium]